MLPFALLFTIGLGVLILIGAIIIWKSDLPINEKLVSLLVILGLFALVSIVSEAKRATIQRPVAVPSTVKRPQVTYNFERTFYTEPTIDISPNSNLPHILDTTELVNDALGGWNPVNSTSHPLIFLYSNMDSSVSLAFKEYSSLLQQQQLPTLYLQLSHPEYSALDLSNALKVPSLDTLEELVKKFNEENKVPNIFIDNAHNALIYDEGIGNGIECPICRFFVSLYDNYAVNIVLISNDAQAREFLRSDNAYRSKVDFYELKDRSVLEIENYLFQKINLDIQDDNKKFTEKNIGNLLKNLGWSLELIEDYVRNIDSYSDVDDFVSKNLQAEVKRVAGFSEFSDLLQSLVTLTEQTKDNSWIPYAMIRKAHEGNPVHKLEAALNANVLIKQNNAYKFSNTALYNAALTAKQGKLFI